MPVMSKQSFRHGDQAALWAWALALLADRRWHALAELSDASAPPLRDWRPALRAFARMGAPLQFDIARGVRALRPLSPLPAPRARGPRPSMPIERHFLLDSTNSHMLRALAAGASGVRACLAEQQSRGRGRRERTWLTPLGGGLALSVAVPAHRLRDRRALPLRVGVVVADALSRLGLRRIGLKWPNDLVVRGRKLGGVLIEGSAAGVVIGLGLNQHGFGRLRRRAVSGLGQPVTSLVDELGARAPSRARVARVVLEAIDTMLREPIADWETRFVRYDVLRDQPVRVIEGAGDEWQGVARGIGVDGALRVETSAGVRLCHAGEVSVRMRAWQSDGGA